VVVVVDDYAMDVVIVDDYDCSSVRSVEITAEINFNKTPPKEQEGDQAKRDVI
jgi:hypothetical protein